MIVAFARLVVRLSAGLAPAHLRARWREEWQAEIEAAADATASSRAALRILQRAAGAPIDAIPSRRAAPASRGSHRRVAWHGWRGDLTQSLRLIARAPGQTTTVVLSLGVGLTACVSVFYVVSLRTREIGVRIALGARRSQVVGLMIRQALRVVGAGAAVGAILAVPIVYVTRANFVGVSPLDPVAIVPSLLLFGVVAVVASAIPSRRAATVDPVDALRSE